jgi:hypothetical protein
MEDVTIPRPAPAYNSRDWRPPRAQLREQPSAYQPRQATPFNNAPVVTNAGFVTSIDPAINQTAQAQPAPPSSPQQEPVVLPIAAAAPRADGPRTSSSSLTLIALRNESIWAVTEYWLAGDRLDYILPSGAHESCALNDVDLMRTTQLNSERGIAVTVPRRPGAPTDPLAVLAARVRGKKKGRPELSGTGLFRFALQGVQERDQLLLLLVGKIHLKALVVEVHQFIQVLRSAIMEVRRTRSQSRAGLAP